MLRVGLPLMSLMPRMLKAATTIRAFTAKVNIALSGEYALVTSLFTFLRLILFLSQNNVHLSPPESEE